MKINKLLLLGMLSTALFCTCRQDDGLTELIAETEDEEQYLVDDSDIDNIADHDDAGDYIWNCAEVIDVKLNGSSASSSGTGLTITGSKIAITRAGNYSFSGSLDDGQIYVDTEDKTLVRLILNNTNLTCSNNAAIYVNNAEKVVLVLADGTTNTVSDGTVYSIDEEDANAAIFSKENLTVYGKGTLIVKGNYNDGLTSKDGLIITSGSITVEAVDDGIRGKDYLVVNSGDISVNCGGDGLKSDNVEDEGRGYISINNGSFNITSGGDAIYGGKDVIVHDGNLNLESGGGSNAYLSNDVSAKSIKSGIISQFYGGSINIDAADDGIHSDGDINIYEGIFSVASGDDGIHSDEEIVIDNTTLTISSSLEGIEGGYITVNNGTIKVTANDDGFNATQGTEVMSDDGSQLIVNGGTITVNMSGSDVDAMDSNGDISINGGIVKLYIPTTGPSHGLDANGTITIGSDATVYENDEVYTGPDSGGRR